MATIKMSQILSFRQHVGIFLEQKLPLPVAYKLTKINDAAKKEAEFYYEKFNAIVDKYSKKDENGNIVFSEDGDQIMIQDDLISECNKALEELMDLEVEINTFNLKIEDFGSDIECTAADIEAITPFFEQEEN